MGAFGGMLQTTKGRNLQAKAQTGVKLNFTRFAVGDGELGGSSILDLNALKHEVKSLSISKFKPSAGQATVGAVLSNQDISTGFYWRELGLFAEDPDIGEILYCYGNAGGNAEYIPAGGGADIIEKAVDIISIIGNATNVSAIINTSLVYASAQDLQEHENNLSAHGLAGKISHSLATAANDFLIASGVGSFVKKSLAEVKSILGLGSAAYVDASTFETPAGAQEKADAAATAGVGAASTVQENLDSHKAESATNAHKDKNIGVVDVNNHFIANSLDGVLDELFTFANDGKTNIAGVVGSPALSSDTFTQLKDKIQTQKNTLASSLTAKGQSSVGTETLASLVGKVANVNTGKRFASGNGNLDYPSNAIFTVNTLTFKPTYVFVKLSYISYTHYGFLGFPGGGSDTGNLSIATRISITSNLNGFTLQITNTLNTGNYSISWYAIE